ncbi:MAG TPA: DUF6677 family protein [Candidatus Acidoferrum sp.]|nr:DUF6677 family protein [Candidatus Acidoferrum sp.]
MNETPTNSFGNADESLQKQKTARLWLVPLVSVSAWLVPGLGHGLLGRWGRAATFFVAVAGLAIVGFADRGYVFPAHSSGPFGTLGFIADVATGGFYLAAHLLERTGSDMALAAGDIGTRFIAAAGVVNLLAIVDVLEITGGNRG